MSRCAALLVLISLMAACGKPKPASPNILLITIDTQRADRLGSYGYDRATSPVLDALAARGTLFENARVPIGRTTQSLASILTGLYPPLHGVRDLWGPHGVLAAERTTLAEVLKREGYRTGGAWAVPFFQDGQGLAQGLDWRSDWTDDVDAEVVSDAALQFLDDTGDEPFFLWLHYRDPHMPYGPPAEERARFGGDYEGPFEKAFYYYPIDARTVNPRELPPDRKERKARIVYGGGGLTATDHRRARDLYDGEVATTDAQIGRVLARLDELGAGEETLIVVTADHGESLGEHDYYYDHGELLYDTCLEVPLIVAGPGVASQRIDASVRTVDLFPTLLDAAGIDSAPVSGESLWPALLGGGLTRGRAAFAEGGALLLTPASAWRPVAGFEGRPVAIVTDRWKLIHTPGIERNDGYELYDLVADPAETDDLAGDPPGDCPIDGLKRALTDWAALVHAEPKAGAEAVMDPEQIRLLEGVGYILGRPKGK